MHYTGSCHCGKVTFTVEGELTGALACNCSICQRKGSLLWFVPRAALQFTSDEANAKTYTFHAHRIQHRFCPECGIHPYGLGKGPDG